MNRNKAMKLIKKIREPVPFEDMKEYNQLVLTDDEACNLLLTTLKEEEHED